MLIIDLLYFGKEKITETDCNLFGKNVLYVKSKCLVKLIIHSNREILTSNL